MSKEVEIKTVGAEGKDESKLDKISTIRKLDDIVSQIEKLKMATY